MYAGNPNFLLVFLGVLAVLLIVVIVLIALAVVRRNKQGLTLSNSTEYNDESHAQVNQGDSALRQPESSRNPQGSNSTGDNRRSTRS